MIEAILAGLAATTPAEGVAVALGLAYSILAVKRSRWCWVAGGASAAIVGVLAWRAKLPMQGALQGYYVVMSIYGFWHWSKDKGEATRAISTLPVRTHLIFFAAILIASVVSSRLLAGQTAAAWPFLDSLTTWGSLVATWMVAQVKLENWLYWILFDAISVFLFASQGLMFVAFLFLAYLIVASVGFISWLRTWRAHAQPT